MVAPLGIGSPLLLPTPFYVVQGRSYEVIAVRVGARLRPDKENVNRIGIHRQEDDIWMASASGGRGAGEPDSPT